MKYTTLGISGLLVSRLSFGAMTFAKGQRVPGVKNHIGQLENLDQLTAPSPLYPGWMQAMGHDPQIVGAIC